VYFITSNQTATNKHQQPQYSTIALYHCHKTFLHQKSKSKFLLQLLATALQPTISNLDTTPPVIAAAQSRYNMTAIPELLYVFYHAKMHNSNLYLHTIFQLCNPPIPAGNSSWHFTDQANTTTPAQ
jgi:hypothetical protein